MLRDMLKTLEYQVVKVKGIIVGENFVIDSNCSKISVQQQQGFSLSVKYIISLYPNHHEFC